MILESLVKDERIISFDCVKSQLTKDTRKINIPDHLADHPEIQGAIKLGFCRFLEPLSNGTQAAYKPREVAKTKFICKHKFAVSFDCIKRLVSPGQEIEIPNHFLDEREVTTAISLGFIVPADEYTGLDQSTNHCSEPKMDISGTKSHQIKNPDVQAYSPESKPILDELKISDIIENPTEVQYKREDSILKTSASNDVFDFLPQKEEAAAMVDTDEIFGFLPQEKPAEVKETPKVTERVAESSIEAKTEVKAEVKPAKKTKKEDKVDDSFEFFDIFKNEEGK